MSFQDFALEPRREKLKQHYDSSLVEIAADVHPNLFHGDGEGARQRMAVIANYIDFYPTQPPRPQDGLSKERACYVRAVNNVDHTPVDANTIRDACTNRDGFYNKESGSEDTEDKTRAFVEDLEEIRKRYRSK